VIPFTLAENAGLNPIAIVTELRNRHANGEVCSVGMHFDFPGCLVGMDSDFQVCWDEELTVILFFFQMNTGINVRKGQITNILVENVVQPMLVSTSALSLATECVRMILKIDDIVSTR